MEINLSMETIETTYNSLVSTKKDLVRQLNKEYRDSKRLIIEHQIEKVEDAMQVFAELIDTMKWQY